MNPNLNRLLSMDDTVLQSRLLNVPEVVIARVLLDTSGDVENKILNNVSERRQSTIEREKQKQQNLDSRSIRAAQKRMLKAVLKEPPPGADEDSRKQTEGNQGPAASGSTFRRAVEQCEELLNEPGQIKKKRRAILKLCELFPTSEEDHNRVKELVQKRLESSANQFIVEKNTEQRKMEELFQKLDQSNDAYQNAQDHRQTLITGSLVKVLLRETTEEQEN